MLNKSPASVSRNKVLSGALQLQPFAMSFIKDEEKLGHFMNSMQFRTQFSIIASPYPLQNIPHSYVCALFIYAKRRKSVKGRARFASHVAFLTTPMLNLVNDNKSILAR